MNWTRQKSDFDRDIPSGPTRGPRTTTSPQEIGKHLSLVLGVCLLLLSGAEAWAKKPQVDPQVPSLRPISAAQAEALAAYARDMRVRNTLGDEDGVAWSMINTSCQERAMALQYAVIAARTPFGDPVIMEATDDLDALELHLLDLLSSAEFDAASINIAGPLITEQVLVLPDGEILDDVPHFRYWSYHHGVALNVEGEFKVLDLSVGDSPLDVETWWQSFVEPGLTCVHAVADDFLETWSYWFWVYNSWNPQLNPKYDCAYTFTPIFTWRWDQDMIVSQVASAPRTMLVQSDAFRTVLLQDHGLTLPEEDIPHVLSLYQAKTLEDLCNVVDLKICTGNRP